MSRVGREREPAPGVPAVDRLDEPDGRDLDQVVERFGAVVVAECEAPREREIALDQDRAGPRIAVSVSPHQLPVVTTARDLTLRMGGHATTVRARGSAANSQRRSSESNQPEHEIDCYLDAGATSEMRGAVGLSRSSFEPRQHPRQYPDRPFRPESWIVGRNRRRRRI
jgi:hypothetical protein